MTVGLPLAIHYIAEDEMADGEKLQSEEQRQQTEHETSSKPPGM